MTNQNKDRRLFLQMMAATPMLAMTPSLLAKTRSTEKNLLLLVELKGGNDALNTLVPYEDPQYYHLRPKLGIKENNLLKLGNGFGLNKAMQSLFPFWQSGDMAWVQGLGYPEPNRSHFRSIEIWETASQANQYLDDGWVAQCYAMQNRHAKTIQGITIGSDVGPLQGRHFNGLSMRDKKGFIALTKQIKAVQGKTQRNALSHLLGVQNNVYQNAQIVMKRLQTASATGVQFPRNKFGRQLETTAQIILSGIDVPVYKVELGSFDTHNNQAKRQTRLLTQLSEGLAAFSASMQKAGLWDNMLIMTYSEFGRRAIENKSAGTDHGTAAAHFALGGRVQGGINKGLIGSTPSLTDLDSNDLKFTTDFRAYYHTIATQWLGNATLWNEHALLPLITA